MQLKCIKCFKNTFIISFFDMLVFRLNCIWANFGNFEDIEIVKCLVKKICCQTLPFTTIWLSANTGMSNSYWLSMTETSKEDAQKCIHCWINISLLKIVFFQVNIAYAINPLESDLNNNYQFLYTGSLVPISKSDLHWNSSYSIMICCITID